MNESPLNAADPTRSAAVMASAGTGKTWLLVTRLIRLLLDGARPDGLLAVTFTRKAAAEMQSRLLQRLRALTECDAATLMHELTAIGAATDTATCTRAQSLYEDLLYTPQPLRLTTFHAFCQELLRRFPLEADVPAGFEVLDSSGVLIDSAWDALFAAAPAEPDGVLAGALELLFEYCGGLHNTRTALLEFLNHRSDWWAFTAGAEDIDRFIDDYLEQTYDVDVQCDYCAGFLNTTTCAELEEFATLLARHSNATNTRHAGHILQALSQSAASADRVAQLTPALLTAHGTPRARKASAAQERALGAAAQARLLTLHDTLCCRLLALNDQRRRVANFRLSYAWMTAGMQLLAHYQQLKRERRQLDFADLEWKAYCLLTQSGNAQWVQYKLDQRIDHLLVDEFQDTNPTQWRLLMPLLEEIAAGSADRARSLFLVGDAKQSIYGFRRADARLLGHAAQWLQTQTGATVYNLDKSRRSATAIMTCVNAVFASDALREQLPAFHAHETFLDTQWGRVEVLAPPPLAPQISAATGLRNPLQQPRSEPAERAHVLEARRIAARIEQLIAARLEISDAVGTRALGYQDIIILLRRRSHAAAYENALRALGIPYLGAARGALLESLEVRDLVALLTGLIVPYDDLALAQVLRSPLFAASDTDLMQLGAEQGPWIDRLTRIGPTLPADAPLARAARLLTRWQALAGSLPVHDLLDRIYSEGNLPARYVAAFPAALQPRVRANLTRFIELALEVDSGRYPSLAHFLARVRALRNSAQDAPDEVPPPAGARVRVMTIHAAKGLEAALVFLADTGPQTARSKAFQVLIDWPSTAARPVQFLLVGAKDRLDSMSRERVADTQRAQQREEANLLYVALTRARHALVISCADAGEDQSGWYGIIKTAMAPHATITADGDLILESGVAPQSALIVPNPAPTRVAVDPRLSQRWQSSEEARTLAPSDGDNAMAGDEDSRVRGRALHRLLELLCRTETPLPANFIVAQVAEEFGLHPDHAELRGWYEEAYALVTDPQHRSLFDARQLTVAYNEIPIQYRVGEKHVYGVIDRLVRHAQRWTVIDYKTHLHATPEQLARLAEPHREQLRLYAEGVRALWPDAEIRRVVLFTRCRQLYEL